MENMIMLGISLLALIIIAKKIWQLVKLVQGQEEDNVCGCNSCSSSCLNRENCELNGNTGYERDSFKLDLNWDNPSGRPSNPL